MLRTAARSAPDLVGLLAAAPWILRARLGLARSSDGPYSTGACAISTIVGIVGIAARRAFYHATLEECSPDLTTHFGTVITQPTARIGRNVWIGAYSLIGRCKLGEGVIIGSRVSVSLRATATSLR